MAEVLRLKRNQLEKVFHDFETLRQFELLFDTLDTINANTLIGLRADVDANTVRSQTNEVSIDNLEVDKADLLNPEFTNNITVNNNIIVVGTVDGRDISVDGAKLDSIEGGAEINTVISVNGYIGAVVLVKSDVGLGNADNTSDVDKPISTATQTALDGKEDAFSKNTAFNKNFGSLTGEVCEGDDSRLSDSRQCNNNFDDPATSRTNIGLGNVDNTSDADKPVSTSQQVALDLKADILDPIFSNDIEVTNDIIVFGLVDGRDIASDGLKLDGIETGAQANTVDSVNGYTGVVVLVKADVGLENVDNTSDADKPVSTAQQTALDGKKDDFTENTAFNKDFGSATGTVCQGDDSRLSDSRTCNNTFDSPSTARGNLDVYSTGEVDLELLGKEDAFSKNTAFNKNFGTVTNTVCQGDDSRLSDSRTCDNTFDDADTARANLGAKREFSRSTQAPTTGFSITFTQDESNQWLVLNPSGSLASGTVTLISPVSATDKQEVMISTTKQISSITIAGNGGTVYGSPSVLAAESTYLFKYDSSLTAWFAIP